MKAAAPMNRRIVPDDVVAACVRRARAIDGTGRQVSIPASVPWSRSLYVSGRQNPAAIDEQDG